jgi:8-oxo-dGTP diphosphatase
MEVRRVNVVAGVILRDDVVLIAQRGGDDSLAHLWEFPGGKVKNGENHQQALVRELEEELGIQVEVGPAVAVTEVNQGDRILVLNSYLVNNYVGEPQALVHQKIAWVKIIDLGRYQMPDPDGPIVQWLRRGRGLKE